MCPCISTCVHVQPNVCSIPLTQLHTNMSASVWPNVCHAVTSFLVPYFGLNVYMHHYVYVCLPDSPYLHLLFGIVVHNYVHPFVVFCENSYHLSSGPTPWLECMHTPVHVHISTKLSTSAPPPLQSCMQTCVILCGLTCVSQLILLPVPKCVLLSTAHIV